MNCFTAFIVFVSIFISLHCFQLKWLASSKVSGDLAFH